MPDPKPHPPLDFAEFARYAKPGSEADETKIPDYNGNKDNPTIALNDFLSTLEESRYMWTKQLENFIQNKLNEELPEPDRSWTNKEGLSE